VADKEVRVEPAALAVLAGSTLNAAKRLSGVQFDAQVELTVPQPVFGNCAGAAELHTAHQELVEAVDAAYEALVGALEMDVDQLYRIAFAYRGLDEDGASRMARVVGDLARDRAL
jgi:hypothetical protein